MGSSSVAYLSQSKYGKLGNRDYSGANKEIYQNKSNSFITGCSYGAPSNANTDYGCQYTYDIEINGTGASTTGTIYGVYDMSGGAQEFVKANYNDEVGGSGFESMPESKYYNEYTSSVVLTACNGKECLSHALSETENWYDDKSRFVFLGYPWIVRGIYGDRAEDYNAGVFRFNYTNAFAYDQRTFRLALAQNT